jgi:hypothetical protein
MKDCTPSAASALANSLVIFGRSDSMATASPPDAARCADARVALTPSGAARSAMVWPQTCRR